MFEEVGEGDGVRFGLRTQLQGPLLRHVLVSQGTWEFLSNVLFVHIDQAPLPNYTSS